MKRIFYAVLSLFLCAGFASRSIGQTSYPLYLSTGYSFGGTGSLPVQDLKSVTRDANGVYHTSIGGRYGSQMSYTVDGSGHLQNLSLGNLGIDTALIRSGFMTADNPGMYPFYPGGTTGFTSDVYNNTYDSVHRAFYMHYGYSVNGIADEDSFTTQIYEKVVPYPNVHSFSPLMGPAGTNVTIKGWGFLNVGYVTFNGKDAGFTIVSDSEIVATAPAGGGYGLIRVSIVSNTDPYLTNIGNTGSAYLNTPFTYLSSDTTLASPRLSESGLYSQGNDTECMPWGKDSVDWESYTSTDSNGTHLEMQTLFQDEPGNICGFQSLAADTSVERNNAWWPGFDPLSWFTGHLYKQGIEYFSRNYRINFGDTVFAHPVGVRLFFTTAELNQFNNRKAKRGEGGAGINSFFITRYDGPNEDTDLYNNADDSMDYTMIKPALFYYGPNNEYCYFEFYTDRFSEFQIATLAGAILLPVKMLGFSATLQNGTSNLSWQTADEADASYYTVQRSTDGVHFTNIGKVNAAGTGGSHNYRYSDNVSSINSTPKLYYRLEITDKNGSATTSNIVSVDLSSRNFITIQPNPARTYAVITCNVAGKKTITVTDMNGRQVLIKTTANTSETIGLSSFAKGMYIVRVAYAGGVSVQKLLVE